MKTFLICKTKYVFFYSVKDTTILYLVRISKVMDTADVSEVERWVLERKMMFFNYKRLWSFPVWQRSRETWNSNLCKMIARKLNPIFLLAHLSNSFDFFYFYNSLHDSGRCFLIFICIYMVYRVYYRICHFFTEK